MKHLARWIALGVAVVVAAFAVVLATQVGDDPGAASSKSALLGKPAPSFSGRLLDDPATTFTDADLAGKVVVVNFWNSWCIPCQDELPALRTFYARHANDPTFAMVGILRDDTAEAAREYARTEGMDWTLVEDPGADASVAFGTRGQPETFVISPSGRIVGTQIGPVSVKDLETLVAAAGA